MQVESISALVASGAAVLGVPAALVVGLRQARAARHAAEMAAQSVREQWRSNNRREAAVSFVIAAENVLERAREISIEPVAQDMTAFGHERRALWRALAVVQLEGPKELADAATDAHKTVNRISFEVLYEHNRERPRLLLMDAAAEGNDTAKRVLPKLNPVRYTLTVESPLWDELKASGLLPRRDLARLRRMLNGSWPPLEPERDFHAAYTQAREEIDAFIAAVRVYLDKQA